MHEFIASFGYVRTQPFGGTRLAAYNPGYEVSFIVEMATPDIVKVLQFTEAKCKELLETDDKLSYLKRHGHIANHIFKEHWTETECLDYSTNEVVVRMLSKTIIAPITQCFYLRVESVHPNPPFRVVYGELGQGWDNGCETELDRQARRKEISDAYETQTQNYDFDYERDIIGADNARDV